MNKQRSRVLTIMKNELNGYFKMSQAIEFGISRYMLYKLEEDCLIQKIARGVYCINDKQLANPDFSTVALKSPKSVVCLLSALWFHELTLHIPSSISIALPFGAGAPKIKYPPTEVRHFSGKSFSEGIESHMIDGVPVKIYSIEKTIADCFRYKDSLGTEVIVEALKLYRERKKLKIDDLMKYAKIRHVENKLIPYLDTII